MATHQPNELHAAPAAVTAALSRELGAAIDNSDVHNLDHAIPQLVGATSTLTRRYGAAVATLAVRNYHNDRTAAGIPGRFTVRPADPAPLAQVTSLVQWATRNLWGPQPDVPVTLRDLVAGAERLVLNTGRRTTVENVLRDRRATGWARVANPGACEFCLMLEGRGPVYKTAANAGEVKDFHTHCLCVVVPAFTAARAA